MLNMRQNSLGDARKPVTRSSEFCIISSKTFRAASGSIFDATRRSTSDTTESLLWSSKRNSLGSRCSLTTPLRMCVIGLTCSALASISLNSRCASSSLFGIEELTSLVALSVAMLRLMGRTCTSLNSTCPCGASAGMARGGTLWLLRCGELGPVKRPGSWRRSLRRLCWCDCSTLDALERDSASSCNVVMSSESLMFSLIALEAVGRANGGMSSSSLRGITLWTFLLVRHV
mmetsp:Transcript_28196/g.65841  ORF Transcript_28196/g.65841 Transcript_28196/m.65841 type:complete len:231 (-) Transcript_28196:321-1013(-)